nr:PhzF family phenazine biosynthesis protein [Neobacillus sp. Marseille-Q6967]
MKFYIVDVFAENKFEGNQLAVCIPEGELNQQEMQKIAKEINFSETTFIMSGLQENGGYDVKIFSPEVELPFAGHPTLGTAYIINRFLENHFKTDIKLNLKVGQIPVVIEEEYAWMTQKQPSFGPALGIDTIAEALLINVEDINADYPIQVVSTGLPSMIVNLKTLDAVKRCAVNHCVFGELMERAGASTLLVFTTETTSQENDLNVRVFMSDPGFLEDPATGSANGNLAGYILEHNFFKSSVVRYRVEQGSQVGRPSLLKVKASKEDDTFSIEVGGKCFVVAEGKWL